MAALLVSLSIAAIMMTVVMPVWKQMARREKEAELVFRGQQYARALRLFGTKYANASPPNLDVLVEQRFIRKKYKDPITNDDFQPVLAGQPVPGTTTPPAQGGARGSGSGPGSAPGLGPLSGSGGRQNTNPQTSSPFSQQTSPFAQQPTGPAGAGQRGFSPIGTPGAGATGGIIAAARARHVASLHNGRT